MAVTSDQLRCVPLFSGMTDRALDAIGGLAEEQSLAAGTALAVENAPGDAFYLLLDGRVAVTRNGTRVVDLGPGDFLGEIALLDGRLRTATATAATDVRAAVIGRSDFMKLMDRHAAVRHAILVALTDRVRQDEAGITD